MAVRQTASTLETTVPSSGVYAAMRFIYRQVDAPLPLYGMHASGVCASHAFHRQESDVLGGARGA